MMSASSTWMVVSGYSKSSFGSVSKVVKASSA